MARKITHTFKMMYSRGKPGSVNWVLFSEMISQLLWWQRPCFAAGDDISKGSSGKDETRNDDVDEDDDKEKISIGVQTFVHMVPWEAGRAIDYTYTSSIPRQLSRAEKNSQRTKDAEKSMRTEWNRGKRGTQPTTASHLQSYTQRYTYLPSSSVPLHIYSILLQYTCVEHNLITVRTTFTLYSVGSLLSLVLVITSPWFIGQPTEELHSCNREPTSHFIASWGLKHLAPWQRRKKHQESPRSQKQISQLDIPTKKAYHEIFFPPLGRSHRWKMRNQSLKVIRLL